MDRPDDVVPVAALEQGAHAVLAARDEVRLDAQAQVGLLTHEAHVLVDVVARRLHPQGMVPDLERLGEAIHVLRDTELLDPPLGRDLAVALGVGRRERGVRRRARRVVDAQVHVVVGQHPASLARDSGDSPPVALCESGVCPFFRTMRIRGLTPFSQEQLGHLQVESCCDLQVLARRLDDPDAAAEGLD